MNKQNGSVDYFEHIEDYLNGTLAEADRVGFERAMAEDEVLRTTVANYPSLKYAVEHEARLQIRKSIDDAKQAAHKSPAPVRRMAPSRWLRAAAIGLAVTVGTAATVANTKYSTANLAQAYYVFPDDLSTNQSGSPDTPGYQQILDNWQSGNRDAALEEGEEYLSLNPGDKEFGYYLGHMFYENGDFERAQELFIPLKSDRRYGDEVDFLLALCDLRLGANDQGEVALERIRNNPTHSMSDESEELLKDLGSPLRVLTFN